MSVRRIARLGIPILALALLPAGPVRAQDENAEQTALARELFTQGSQLAREERFDEAADRFWRAYEIRPSPVIAYNLAAALTRLGRLVEAAEFLRAVDSSARPDVRQMAAALMTEIQPRIARLVVEVDGPRRGVTIRLDERDLPDAVVGVAFPADPGSHVVRALRDGEEVASEPVEVPEGGEATVTLRVPAPPEQPAGPGLLTADGRGTEDDEGGSVFGQWWFWTAVAVVAVGAGVTAYLLLREEEPGALPSNTNPPILVW